MLGNTSPISEATKTNEKLRVTSQDVSSCSVYTYLFTCLKCLYLSLPASNVYTYLFTCLSRKPRCKEDKCQTVKAFYGIFRTGYHSANKSGTRIVVLALV